ncbi:MAG: galactokinase [Phycisphaerales bacterium]|nr:MAG: galactokinase [Phycisphaerales bacterium]
MTDTPFHHDFERRFGRPPACVVRAPGRVNLIGEHTDYNDGLVLPLAIDLALSVSAAARPDRSIRVYSACLGESLELPPSILDRAASNAPAVAALPRWGRYVAGVAALAARRLVNHRGRGAVVGADLLIEGDLPIGAGLSSSAALEVGVAKALLELWCEPAARRIATKRNREVDAFGPPCATRGRVETGESARAEARGSLADDLSDLELAALCRKAEQDYAGAPCGVMDQLCCTMARAGHALLIDCESIKTRHIPLNLGTARIVVIDTGVRHAIAAGEYARRRLDCELAVRTLNRLDPHVTSLRKLTVDRLDEYAAALDSAATVDAATDRATQGREERPSTLARRVRHVVTENERVHGAVVALERGDLHELGRLMSESHRSLRDDYEVSCPELDAAVETAESIDGVYGARMTGGGFGGCAMALADAACLPGLRKAFKSRYDNDHPTPARLLSVSAADGARVVWTAAPR